MSWGLPEEEMKRLDLSSLYKQAWQIEDDFVTEEVDNRGDLVRRNSDGELHSLYSPAIEWRDGARSWLQNGKVHRLDGPAAEYIDGNRVWWYEGKKYGLSIGYPDSDLRSGYTQEKFEEDLRNEGKIASMKQEKDELFICLWAPDDVYKRFSHIEDLDKELHVTLIYRKDIKTTKELNDSLLTSIAKICDEVGTIKCKATGIGTFNNDDKSDAILINCVKGATIYEKLVDLVTNLYGEWEIKYGYLPHMTLKYEGTGEVNLKKFKPFSWNVKHIGVRIGNDNYLVNVKTGEYKKTKQILSSVEDSTNILENSLPENSNSFFMPKEDKEIKRTNPKRYDKITDIYDTTDSELSNITDNPILGIASQKLSWQTEEDFVTEEVDKDGDLVRRNSKGEYHSLYSPAIENPDGYKAWYQNGKSHRLDGPAIEDSNGYKSWWYEGKRHRLDGPAAEYPSGSKYWYYEGKCYGESPYGYTQEQFEKDLRDEGKIASMKLAWGEEDYTSENKIEDGNEDSLERKNNKGQLHSLYSPALISHGNKWWYQNGKVHRLDGPAAEYIDGNRVWWYEGKCYGNSSHGYNQEKFEQDLRNEGKIASQKLSWYQEPKSFSRIYPGSSTHKILQMIFNNNNLIRQSELISSLGIRFQLLTNLEKGGYIRDLVGEDNRKYIELTDNGVILLEYLNMNSTTAGLKFSWGDENDVLHNYVFIEHYSKSIMPSDVISYSEDQQEKFIKDKLDNYVKKYNMDIVINNVVFIGDDDPSNSSLFMKHRYYEYDITCSRSTLVKLAKATRMGSRDLVPLFNIYSMNITEDGLPFGIETVFHENWGKLY